MNGVEVAESIHNLPLEPPPRLLLLTARGLEACREKNEPPRFAAFLAKPVTPMTLWNAVLKALGKKAAPQRLAEMDPAVEQALALRRGARALLVEDNEINQEVATAMLAETGVEVTMAANGEEAVQAVAASRYDLILMDVQMPVMDGYTATGEIRASGLPGAAEIPIIAMTAYAMRGDAERSLAAGMDGHLTKPVDVNELTRMLSIHARRRPGEL